MSVLRAVIVDDERLARQSIADLLGADAEVEIVGQAASGATALSLILEVEPDLLFLDVQMPGGDGFEVLQRLGSAVPPLVIFVTAFDRHAIRAFEVAALDYLLKPFDDERFATAVRRAKAAFRSVELNELQERLLRVVRGWPGAAKSSPAATATETGLVGDRIGVVDAAGRYRRLFVRVAGRVRFVDIDDIAWIEAADYCARVHTARGADLVRASLTLLESRLDRTRFARVHRSAIVALGSVVQLHRHGAGGWALTLRDGTVVPVSRARRARVQSLLGID